MSEIRLSDVIAYRYVDPDDGRVMILDPANVTIVLRDDGAKQPRTPEPTCSCPLIDVSVSYDEPAFVLGAPDGCPVHGVERDAAVRAAQERARKA